MRVRRLRLAALLAAGWLLLNLTACRESAPVEDTPVPTSTPAPSVAPGAEPAEFALACYPAAGFHPITGENKTNLALGGLLYEGLFALDQHFQVQNVLCQSYSVSEDGLTWRFVVRDGVTFSDGSPMTAADVAASLNLARTSVLYSARFPQIGTITAADGTVTVTLTAPNAALPALLDIPVCKGSGARPLGTGPYALTGEEDLSLTARAGWWQEQPLPRQTIPLRSIQAADDLIHAFDTRDVALVSTDLTGSTALGFSGSYETIDYPTSTLLYVGFNLQQGPCRDSGVRRALLRGLDRSAVTTVSLSRHAQAAALPVSPSSPLYAADLARELEFDPQAVERLLTEAGWTLEAGIWSKNGRPLELTLAVSSDSASQQAVAELLAEGLTQLGIPTQLRVLAWDDYLLTLEQGGFDLYLGEVRLTGDFDLSPLLSPAGALNYGGYDDAQASALLAACRAASGQGRDLAARALFQYLAEEPPFAALCFKNGSVLIQWRRISGLTPTQQNIFYGFPGWAIA